MPQGHFRIPSHSRQFGLVKSGNGGQVFLNGHTRRLGRVLFQHRFKLSLGTRQVAELVVGTRHVQSGTSKIGIDRQHPLQRQRGLVGLATVQRSNTQQVVKAQLARAVKLQGFEQGVSLR
ncbi:hypothetical protein GALL_483410 [mine drainage metagenome]|uniref:Uncharacterized protein n=1 Tax=mine drainage metagenome TaxID=410659 RepID=A0A1J5PFR5_9ZZZZ